MRSEKRSGHGLPSGRLRRGSLVAAGLTLLVASVGAATDIGARSSATAVRWIGPDGEALPFERDEEVEEFLLSARIVHSEVVGKGINRPTKLLLERDGVQAHAVWRTVECQYPAKTKGRFRHFLPFRDSYSFERAAFRLSRLLGLTFVPPAVERRIGGETGSVQLWVEDAFDEQERRLSNWKPPDPPGWRRQMDLMAVFDALIQNDDRNQGNILIDAGWNVWLIDHTRAFVPDTRLREPDRLYRCSRDLWQRLQTLDRQDVRRALGSDLTTRELTALFVRWQKVVAHLKRLIEERGEERVLFEAGPS